MARLRELDAGLLRQVADQLGQFLSGGEKSFGAALSSRMTLQEHFPVMALLSDAAGEASGDLREFLRETGTQLHQVARDGEPFGFSVSHLDRRSPVIDQFTETVEAQSIARAVLLVDREGVSDDYEARIVDVRALGLGAIVLVSDQHKPSLVAPFRVPLHQSELQVGRIYTSAEFRAALRRLPRGGGLVTEPSAAHEAGHAYAEFPTAPRPMIIDSGLVAVRALSNEQIIQAIAGKPLVEVLELVKAMEEKFGVTAAAAPVGVAARPATGQVAPAEEGSAFTIVLKSAGEKKVEVIKAVRAITGLGLKEAKDLVESAPSSVKDAVSKDDSAKFKQALEAAGAIIEITGISNT